VGRRSTEALSRLEDFRENSVILFMKYPRLAFLAAVTLALACPVQAHHSFAMFDKNRPMTVKGVVRKVEWRNPHVFLFVEVANEKGGTIQYAVECNSPNVLMRTGWKVNTVKVGDSVSVGLFPLRNGAPGGLLDSVTLPDGKMIKG
jgi:hypothetical protein